VPDIFIQF